MPFTTFRTSQLGLAISIALCWCGLTRAQTTCDLPDQPEWCHKSRSGSPGQAANDADSLDSEIAAQRSLGGVRIVEIQNVYPLVTR